MSFVRLAVVFVVAAVAAPVFAVAGRAGARAAIVAPAPATPVSVAARLDGAVRRIPRSFLGVSVEWFELPGYEAAGPHFADMLGLLRVAGQRVPVRIGGDSADSTYLARPGARLPPAAYVVDPSYFRRLGQLARWTPLSLLVDVNLPARSTAMAARLARELRSVVPPSSLAGFEVGNEPDLYGLGVVGERAVRPGTAGLGWVFHYGPLRYAADFSRYVAALRSVWPHVRYAGPGVISGRTDFARASVRTGKLSLITAHRYAYNACAGPASPRYPAEAGYLSAARSRAFAATIAPMVAIARRSGVPLRLTEVGSSICGVPGLTNTFATALWGTRTLLDLLAEGADGINVHIRPGNPSTAIGEPAAGAVTANPLFYGMVLVTRTLGGGGTLTRVALRHAPADLSAWAVRSGRGTVRVVLVNTSARDVRVAVDAGTAGNGTIEALTAPGPGATSGVRLAGRSVDGNGRWTGLRQVASVHAAGGAFRVAVPRDSAALLTVHR